METETYEVLTIEKNDYFLVPIDEMIQPKTGYRVYVNYWWFTTVNSKGQFCMLRYRKSSWQCNSDKRLGAYRHDFADLGWQQFPTIYVTSKYDWDE